MSKLLPILRERGKIGVFSLLRRRFKQVLVSLIVFFSATQLAKHYWPSYALVRGIRVDYLAPSLGFFDLLALVFIFFTSFRQLSVCFSRLRPFLLFVSLGLVSAPLPHIALNYSFHLILYSFLACLLVNHYRSQLSLPLLLTLAFQFFLGLFQIFKKQAGWFYWLGERSLTPSTLGVAKTSFFNFFTLRAYGTFSHPNVMAGWALLALALFFRWNRSPKLKILALFLTFGIMVLAQSRLAFFVFSLISIFEFARYLPAFPRSFLVLIFLSGSAYFLAVSRNLALSRRLSLILTSWHILKRFPFFGSGLGASIAFYSQFLPPQLYLQPDHNSLTLLFSWTGLFGLGAGLIFLSKLLPKLPPVFWFGFLFLFSFDHYFFTSSQGLFIIILFFYEIYTHPTQTPD